MILVLIAALLGLAAGAEDYYPTVMMRGAVLDGEFAIFDGVTGRFIRSSHGTNATYWGMTNFVAVASSSNWLCLS